MNHVQQVLAVSSRSQQLKPYLISIYSAVSSSVASPSANVRFDPDASIVLVGMHGSGKSTLAIIASTAMKRRIVETEKAFHEATGLSTTAFKKTHGSVQYQQRQYGVLQRILSAHQKGCIIVSSWMEPGAQHLFQEFKTSHPVIHIVRDQKAVADYLQVADQVKLLELLNYSANTYRACVNLEFFNISEEPLATDDSTIMESTALDPNCDQKSPAPYLTLKRAERHFLKFLSLVTPKGTIPFIETAFPLASVPAEKRQFTYAVSFPLSKFLTDYLRIEDLETGADAIEIVLDDVYCRPEETSGLGPARASQISRIVAHIRRNVVIPIIFHVPWPRQGIATGAQKTRYMQNILHGLLLAPEYVTVDLRLDEQSLSWIMDCKKRSVSKYIGTVNVPESQPSSWTDPIWMSHYQKARDIGCDLVRLLRPATQIEDNFELNHLRHAISGLEQPELPVIAFNTGTKGRNSQCFNQILTSVIPESLVGIMSEDDTSSSYIPPAITALQATRALHSCFVNDAMKLYVFGANVGYSMSPAMHNTALKACGIPHEYRPYSTDSLKNIQHLVHDPLFAGASVGLPFKIEVISLTHSLSSHAKAIGAVNTLIPVRSLNSDGSVPNNAIFHANRAGPVLGLYGENTDWIGIRACIRRGLSPANAVRSSTSGLIIGAGGMARAAVYSMLQLGVKNIAIYNRTPSNADKLVAHFTRLLARDDLPLLSPSTDAETIFHILRSRDEPWPAGFRPATMIVSCIPTHAIGDSPAPHFTLPAAWMQSSTGGVVVELAYKYLNTPLLEQVRAEAHRGWVPMDGLDLLPEQGFAQFELFTGRRAPRRLMRGEVFRSYPEEQGKSNQTQLQPRLENIVEQEP
ncbi:type I 3-dehydroquinase-domain-containing protein [Pseudomassariella vexata]|uniref:Type I 3-dehydroquinase-domain-containing protein n=1 Tax=Pseudomassariella vexata TaxID=1141098 RepID=A0A1Y2EHW4_9PEZI|nr:type I 3-dehydroquinase-domain-containing protein [Pseudomassariella vexata]ORY70365.1 type I 3-dehydroquinase-domain-containing protein [Pseudomassariella vexata]